MFQELVEKSIELFYSQGLTGLFLLAFAESSFFPVPPDILIISFTLASPENWWIFALTSSIGSILGAGFGYFLGFKIGEPLLEKITKKSIIKKAHGFFEKYGSWAVLLSAFTPIPFKVFTILSGMLYLDIKKFFAASIAGRSTRFFLVAFITMNFGRELINILDKTLVFIAVIVFVVAAIVYFKKK